MLAPAHAAFTSKTTTSQRRPFWSWCAAVLLGVRRPEQSDFLEDAVLRGAWGLQAGGSVLGALQGFVRAGP